MRDGLVMFESPEDADRFASKLEEEGHSQASGTQPPGSPAAQQYARCMRHCLAAQQRVPWRLPQQASSLWQAQ